ncbi:hypothetical protein EJB05_49465, partial [Eragrostis curvula]
RGEETQGPVAEEEVAATAVRDLPPGEGIVGAGDAGEEDIGAADRGGEVRVGAAADGRKAGDLAAVGAFPEDKELIDNPIPNFFYLFMFFGGGCMPGSRRRRHTSSNRSVSEPSNTATSRRRNTARRRAPATRVQPNANDDEDDDFMPMPPSRPPPPLEDPDDEAFSESVLRERPSNSDFSAPPRPQPSSNPYTQEPIELCALQQPVLAARRLFGHGTRPGENLPLLGCRREDGCAQPRLVVAQGDHTERQPAVAGLIAGAEQEVIHGDQLAAVPVGELVVRRRREEIQGPGEGVVDDDLLVPRVTEEEAAATTVHDLPPGEGIVGAGDAGEEHVGAADRGGKVRVGAAPDGREAGDLAAIGVEEEAQERGRVQLAEAAAESRGGADGGEEGAAGEGGADEGWEGGEAEEDLAEEVVGERKYGGGDRW